MRGNEFLDKMDLIDPAYIEAADAVPKTGRTIWTGWRAALAACVCLVLLAGTAAAATMVIRGSGVRRVNIFTNGENESHRMMVSGQATAGYTINAEVRKFPVSELSEEIQAVSGEIARQFETASGDRDEEPGIWKKTFSSAEEAREFVRLDSVKKLNWDIGEHYKTSLFVQGDAAGKIKDVQICTIYLADDISLNMFTDIFTEYSDNRQGGLTFLAMEDVDVTGTVYTAAGGKQCQIISSSAFADGHIWINGCLAEDGILYSLFANCAEQDAARAEELLHQWADMF